MINLWNPKEHSFEENARWSQLRAMEWGVLPAFITGPIVPLLLIFMPALNIIVFVGFFIIIWSFFRYKFVNPYLASAASIWWQLSYLTIFIASILLIIKGHYFIAVLAFIWPFISAFYSLLIGGTQVGV